MKDFAAIDFETANQQRTSVCSVGIVIVRDGEVADSYDSSSSPRLGILLLLEHPGSRVNLEDTMNADVFPKVWAEFAPKIEGLPLVAHNAPFDEGCLKAVFRRIRDPGISRLRIPLHLPCFPKKAGYLSSPTISSRP